MAWEAWADEPIEPFLTIRYMPAIYWVREVTAAFRNPRVIAEGNAWALSRAEGLVSTEQMRFRAMSFLNCYRRERTWFDEGGRNPRQQTVTYDNPHTVPYM